MTTLLEDLRRETAEAIAQERARVEAAVAISPGGEEVPGGTAEAISPGGEKLPNDRQGVDFREALSLGIGRWARQMRPLLLMACHEAAAARKFRTEGLVDLLVVCIACGGEIGGPGHYVGPDDEFRRLLRAELQQSLPGLKIIEGFHQGWGGLQIPVFDVSWEE